MRFLAARDLWGTFLLPLFFHLLWTIRPRTSAISYGGGLCRSRSFGGNFYEVDLEGTFSDKVDKNLARCSTLLTAWDAYPLYDFIERLISHDDYMITLEVWSKYSCYRDKRIYKLLCRWVVQLGSVQWFTNIIYVLKFCSLLLWELKPMSPLRKRGRVKGSLLAQVWWDVLGS